MIAPRPEPARCRHCPAAPGSSCAGVAVARLCQLVDPDHPDHEPAYRSLLNGVPPPSRRLRGLGETLALLAAMKACPHRVDRTDCGCGGLATCTSGKGRDGVVHSGDCFDCLDSNIPKRLPPRVPGEENPP